MKKITKLMIGVTLILSIIIAICQISYAKEDPTTINLVATRFNTCKIVNEYKADPNKIHLKATDTDKSLTVEVEKNGNTESLVYSYNPENYILTAKYAGGDSTIQGYWREVTNIIIDCIGQLNNGYMEGALFDTLNSSGVSDYTLAENGFHITDNQDSSVYLAEININKAIAKVDTDMYIKVSDLEDQKEKIKGDGKAQKSVGNAIFYKSTVDGTDYIVIGEKGEFTYVANKSLNSALKVFFDSSAEVEYFYDNYSDIATEGNKRFQGFRVEVNPIMNEDEEEVLGTDGSYKFVRITIDRDAIKEALEGQSGSNVDSSENGSSSNSSSSSTSPKSDTLPKTGGEVNIALIVLYAIMGIAGVSIIILSANSKKAN